MTDPSSAPAVLLARPLAVRLAFALLAGFTVLLGLTFFDNAHRAELEQTVEVTAVGDTAYFQAPEDPAKFPLVAAKLAGRPLYVSGPVRVNVRDTHVMRVGRDAAAGLNLYRLSATAGADEVQRVGKGERDFLLKTAPNEYAKAEPLR